MNIDLTLLNNRNVNHIDISNTYTLTDDYILNDNIVKLGDINVNGVITLDDDSNLKVECSIKGVMTILDSISLEEVPYSYEIDYNDIVSEECRDGENSIDMYEFLWENISLEIPLRYTKVEDYSKYHGDGWKLVQEDEFKIDNNPFSELLKDFDK